MKFDLKKIFATAALVFFALESLSPVGSRIDHKDIHIIQANSYPMAEVMTENMWNPFSWCQHELYPNTNMTQEEMDRVKEAIDLVPEEFRNYMKGSEIILAKNRKDSVSGFYSKFSRFYGCNGAIPVLLPGESIVLNLDREIFQYPLVRSVLLHEFVHAYTYEPKNFDVVYKWAKHTGWVFSKGRWSYEGEYCRIFEIGKIFNPFEDLAYSVQYYCHDKTKLDGKRIKLIEEIFHGMDLDYCWDR